MDRNTVIGLVLIGLILSVFTIFSQPSEEDLKKMEEEQQAEQLKAEEESKDEEEVKQESDKETTQDLASNWVLKLDEDGKPVPADSGMVVYTDPIAGKDTIIAEQIKEEVVEQAETASVEQEPEQEKVEGEIITLENEKLIINFDTKGGQIAGVRLKEYESYDDYAKKDGKITPITLFKEGDASNGIILPINGKKINTAEKLFVLKKESNNKLVFEHQVENGGTVKFVYSLKPDAYDIDYDIKLSGFDSKLNTKNITFNWDVAYRRTERLFSEQRRVSTICFNYSEEDFSYLSEITDDNEDAEDDIDWISYKQSYFSSFIKPELPFEKEGSSFEVKTYGEDHERVDSHLKDFSSTLNLNIKDGDNATVRLNWFFGPNEYQTLRSYDSGYENVLNYGWGLFRWINIYAVQPLFAFLQSTGMSIGIAILLLTLILKFALMPIQWKMYTSSAKMRILKPEIEAINEKYPEKDDAMKKQMETMALYRESGASPFSGCVPMLIQMPILLAVFRFFPSTFDLRQQSFLWADDLSSYDSILDFNFDIWLYGDHISLFTLLMAGTTLIYTHINSGNMSTPQQPGMPNMKIIMYFFPIMMIFFFNNYSSGLSYYYFISTLTSILIMVLIKRYFVDEEKLKAKMAAKKAVKGQQTKKKSKFQERLEQMQKAQLEQAKRNKGKKK